jgi:pantoate--beta-alanine ligase
VNDLSFPIELQVIPTRREHDGLAMSSRNLRLTKDQRQKSLTLFESLSDAKSALLNGDKWSLIKEKVSKRFDEIPDCQLEYFELVHPETFNLIQEFDPNMKSSICVAAYVGDVRLIDNMPVQS